MRMVIWAAKKARVMDYGIVTFMLNGQKTVRHCPTEAYYLTTVGLARHFATDVHALRLLPEMSRSPRAAPETPDDEITPRHVQVVRQRSGAL